MGSITMIDPVSETIRVPPYAVPFKTLVLPVKPVASTFRAQEGSVAALEPRSINNRVDDDCPIKTMGIQSSSMKVLYK